MSPTAALLAVLAFALAFYFSHRIETAIRLQRRILRKLEQHETQPEMPSFEEIEHMIGAPLVEQIRRRIDAARSSPPE